jgi:hypothetical protein
MARPKLEDRPNKLNTSERPHRVPINGLRDKMSVEGQEPGWHYCWVNDYNVPKYEGAGYVFVTHEVTVGSKHVNVGVPIGEKVSFFVGNGTTAYLMRLQDEYFIEDEAHVQGEVDEREAAMKANLNSKEDGRYGSVRFDDSKKR